MPDEQEQTQPEQTETPAPAYEVDLTALEDSMAVLSETLENSVAVQTETLVHLGNIESYALFGVVVCLCFFSYKFFRMFF